LMNHDGADDEQRTTYTTGGTPYRYSTSTTGW
jgi:hypothetical protein